LKIEGIEYDFKRLQKLEREHSINQYEKGNTAYFISCEIEPNPSIERHRIIDGLSNVSKNTRSTTDCVNTHVIDSLKDKAKKTTERIKNNVVKDINSLCYTRE